MQSVYEMPSEESTADKALYAKLQREAQAREDLALTVPLSTLITAPTPEPRFAGGRWVL